MSNPADSGAKSAYETFASLEGSVGRALERLADLAARTEAAEKKSAELNDLMRRFTGNPDQGGDLLSRLRILEEENVDLRARLDRGREGVERLLARVRFLENQQ